MTTICAVQRWADANSILHCSNDISVDKQDKKKITDNWYVVVVDSTQTDEDNVWISCFNIECCVIRKTTTADGENV